MASPSYGKQGLVIQKGGSGTREQQIRDLQTDLRQLGYLRSSIDGVFGTVTDQAVRALQHDLLHNYGKSRQSDGDAPVSVLDYNRGRVVQVTGAVEQRLAECISDMVDDPNFPKLPRSDNPKDENQRIVAIIRDMPSREVPIPFLMGMLLQESGLKHYREPAGKDKDAYIVTGLDTNANQKYIVTSRGYGAGQYTLFHHPPRREEVEDFMLDVQKNLQKAMKELREKFDDFVNGNTTGYKADDRIAEYGNGPLRLCKYPETDSRYMRDCKQCMAAAGQFDIREGVTPFYEGSAYTFVPTQYYRKASYDSVPIRKKIGCDWPYAVRRYNGSGINSYHYQARVLKNVLVL